MATSVVTYGDFGGEPAGSAGTAGVWHDLAHELATIRVLISAARVAPDDRVRRELLELIDAEADEATALLKLARPGADSAELVDVASVVRSVLQTLAPTTAAELTVRATAVGPVRINRLALRRILRNLIDNAARAAAVGRVEVRVARAARGEGVVIEVADSGPGFGHGPAGLESRGLSIVLELAATAGGAIDIGTSDLGGAAVTLTLPALRAG